MALAEEALRSRYFRLTVVGRPRTPASGARGQPTEAHGTT